MNLKPLFLVATLIALFAIGGMFWVIQNRQMVADPIIETPVQAEPEVPTSVFDWKPQQQVTKTFKAIAGEDGWVWFPVPELGIEIKVRKEVASELAYQTKEISAPDRTPLISVQLTTTRLAEISRKLYKKDFEADGSYVCNVGFFGGYMSIPNDFDDEEIYGYEKGHGVKIDESFIWYISPQTGCVIDQTSQDAEYENALLAGGNWWGGSKSEYTETQNYADYLKKAIRKIK